MNRRERRDFLKHHPSYRKNLKNAAARGVEGLEEMFKKKWEADEVNNEEINKNKEMGKNLG